MVGTDFPSPKAIPPRTSSTSTSGSPVTVVTKERRSSSKQISEGDWLRRMSASASHSHSASHTHSASLGTIADGATWTTAKEKILRGPYEYLLNQPGKSIRKQLILAFNQWLEVPDESVEIINRVVAMLHTASLLIDDVEDNSELRRGIPVTHAIYGVAQTLNSANYMYFVALQELVKLNNPTVLHIYTEEMCNLHRGQGMDLFWRDTLTTPTEEDYFEMVGNKTGGLFRLAIKLMQAESKVDKDCVGLVGLMGVIFQIRDDYMNLWSNDYSQNKGMCEDLTEGKFSFPVIHSIRTNPSSLVLINILKQKTKDETVKRYAVGYMEQTGSFAYTRKILAELLDRARSMIEELDEGAGRAGPLLEILGRMGVE